MNVITRGVRNAFRNGVRSLSIVVILGLSIGLSLTMLIAHQAVKDKIASVKSSIGNTIAVAPAGLQGFEGGGNPLTTSQLATVAKLTHVTKVDESINDRLTSTNTNLASAIDAGSLGRRFGGESGGASTNVQVFSKDGSAFGGTFTPPVTAIGSTDTTTVSGSTITIKSGKQIDGAKDTNTALVGTTLATKNNLTVGSTFTAYGTTITVAGIFDTGTTFSNNQVIFSLPTLQRLSSQTGDITSATVYVDSISNMDSVTSAVKSKLGSAADVTSAKASAESAVAPLESIERVSLFSLIGAVIAGAVIILLTMVMIVRERKREIGVIKAIGGSNLRIMIEFMIESLTLTILGAVIGLLIGVIGGNPVTKMLVTNSTNSATATVSPSGGVVTSGLMPAGGPGMSDSTTTSRTRPQGFGRVRNNAAVKGLSNIHAEIGWSILLEGFGVAVLIAVLGSAFAASLISRVRPSQVMRAD